MHRTTTFTLSLSFVATLTVGGCKKGDEADTASRPAMHDDTAGATASASVKSPSGAEPAASAASGNVIEIPQLALTVETPEPAQAKDMPPTLPFGIVEMAGHEFKIHRWEDETKTIADAQTYLESSADQGGDVFKEATHSESADGGWTIEWEATAAKDQSPVFGVWVRKTIDGKVYDCVGRVPAQAGRDAIAKACATMKPAPDAVGVDDVRFLPSKP